MSVREHKINLSNNLLDSLKNINLKENKVMVSVDLKVDIITKSPEGEFRMTREYFPANQGFDITTTLASDQPAEAKTGRIKFLMEQLLDVHVYNTEKHFDYKNIYEFDPKDLKSIKDLIRDKLAKGMFHQFQKNKLSQDELVDIRANFVPYIQIKEAKANSLYYAHEYGQWRDEATESCKGRASVKLALDGTVELFLKCETEGFYVGDGLFCIDHHQDTPEARKELKAGETFDWSKDLIEMIGNKTPKGGVEITFESWSNGCGDEGDLAHEYKVKSVIEKSAIVPFPNFELLEQTVKESQIWDARKEYAKTLGNKEPKKGSERG